MKGNCEVCGKEIEIKLCCSGRDCGCMGLPTEAPVCSDECYTEFNRRYGKDAPKTDNNDLTLND